MRSGRQASTAPGQSGHPCDLDNGRRLDFPILQAFPQVVGEAGSIELGA